jgi:hypothetical protein
MVQLDTVHANARLKVRLVHIDRPFNFLSPNNLYVWAVEYSCSRTAAGKNIVACFLGVSQWSSRLSAYRDV